MAGNDLNQKYTIERYCSKADLVKAFGTGIVDPIWNQLVEFRRRLSVEMPIYDAFHTKFRLTYIDPMQAKNAQTNDHVSSYVGGFNKLQAGSTGRFTFTRDMLKISLKEIAKFNHFDASDVTLTNVVEGNSVSPQYKILSNYYKALLELQRSNNESINEEFLAKYYAILRGEEELTCFYRINDAQTVSSRALIDRSYDQGIPSRLLDEIMPELLDYISNGDVSLVSRISALFFMFKYVKPFDVYNMELACIIAKRAIAGSNVNASSIYVPIESFINDKSFFGEITNEVKKTHDFTYAFIKGSDLINAAFDIAIERIHQVYSTSLDTEVKLGSDEKKIKEEFGVDIKPEQPKTPTPKRTETKDQIIAKAEESAKHLEVENLSEKELKAKAQDLLEKDPFLSKHQAHFYVHHCVPGKFYSIQQYVKFEHVVYETARTSLDFLAKNGYYRQLQVKNKFVYTPISKE